MIVVDTTVLAAWMIEPSNPGPVDRLRDSHEEWAAPDLWRHELINVIWKYIRTGQLDVAKADAIMEEADLVMSRRTFRVSPRFVLNTALEFGISTYDAQFVALAREMNTRLYTHDRTLIAKCPEIARHPEDLG